MFECTRVRYTAVVLEYVYGRTKFSSMNPWATHDHMMHGHMQFARHSNTLIVTKKFENYWLMLNFPTICGTKWLEMVPLFSKFSISQTATVDLCTAVYTGASAAAMSPMCTMVRPCKRKSKMNTAARGSYLVSSRSSC